MANRLRENKLYFYFSDEELERLNDRVKQLGIKNRSAFMRKMILDGYIIETDLAPFREAVSLMRYMSNNLNQYAHVANATGSIYREEIEDLKEKQEKLFELLKKILLMFSKTE